MIDERAPAISRLQAQLKALGGLHEGSELTGVFTFELYEREGGPRLWRNVKSNIVCTFGKNLALNTFLAGSGYTVTGPFLGLISAVGFTAVSQADTMASHPGWVEAGNANAPQYSGTRDTATFAAASGGSISLSAAASFTFTSSGTVQGGFLTFGPGAVNTVDSTTGTLYSAGTFAQAQPVISGNVLNVNYTASM